jgi:hypothetical protein
MTATLEPIVEALRNELQQSGEMLALLEAQHHAVAQGQAGSLLTSISAVEAQSRAMQEARHARETQQQRLAWAVSQPEAAAFHELLPRLPGEYRPLLSALVQELNQLHGRIRQVAEQNQGQLRRSLELMDRFLAAISAQAELPPPVAALPSAPCQEADPQARPISTAVV